MVAATLWTSAALACYRYGPVYHKSEAGKVTIDPAATPGACTGAVVNNAEPCLETCATDATQCYNYYRPNGFGGDGTEGDCAGGKGGSGCNYGMSQGGCFVSPVDSAWTGTSCVSNLDTTQAYKDGVPTDDIRQNCCSTDMCNDRPNAAAKIGTPSATVLLAVAAHAALGRFCHN